MTTPLLSQGTQPYNQAEGAEAGANGEATFAFPAPPMGMTITGTLNCPSAPPGAVFTAEVGAMVGGTQVGEWGGNSVYGPVQAANSQVLVVTATGLVAGQNYLLSWIGSADPSDLVQPLYPAANSTALTAETTPSAPSQILGQSGLVSGAAQSLAISPFVRTLALHFSANGGAAITNVLVTGATTGFTYYDQPPYLGPNPVGGANLYLVIVPIVGILDGTINLTVTTVGGVNYHADIYGDTIEYDETIFYNGLAQAESSTAVGATVLVTGPARLLTASVEVSSGTNAEAALNMGGIPLLEVFTPAAGGTVANSLTFPPGFKVPPGVNVTAGIITVGNVAVSWAYP